MFPPSVSSHPETYACQIILIKAPSSRSGSGAVAAYCVYIGIMDEIQRLNPHGY